MNCAGCGRANPRGARFCGGCGTPLAPRCPTCGVETQADARFCVACGSSLAARPAEAAGERKVVTIVFADLAGSTALHERLDAEPTRAFMDRYYRAMRSAVESHGGTVTQLLGDGVKAVFGIPRVAEDDALRAVRAAVEMQRAFRELASEQSQVVGPVGLRVAVHTGEVVAKGESEIIGDPVNVAARLQQEAREGDVLVGESTQRLVSELVTLAPFGTFALKGRAEPVASYRVISLERPAGAPAVAFVGREDELARLLAVYEAAVASPGARLAVILGSPGLGKSRLLTELGRRLGERATLLTAQCNAAGGGTFAPIASALRTWLRIDDATPGDASWAAIASAISGEDSERARIADGVAALLAGTPASPEETFFVVRRLLTALAAARPVVLAIDDLQWAEPLLLDLTEHLVQWSRDAPLLVLAAARPELREARSSLAAPGALVADVVTLTGLDAAAATRLAANTIGAEALPAAIAGRVLATSEGNPLFVGELVRMLVHDGVLRREGNRWTAGVEPAALEMPPTIHALLAARIERLRPEERSVLERAAVIGRQFSRTAVAQLLPPEITDLDARLEALRRSQLIEPDTGWLLGEPVLRFHHVLIRDAAYRRLLKNTRAELHGRFADWLESRVGEAVDHDETIGWHLEQAHRHLGELGPLDERGRARGERASRRLGAAGRRALERDDVPLAANLLGRALERLDPADPARAGLALDACEALLAAGEIGAASAAIDELGRLAAGSERLRAWHICFAGELAAQTDPKALRATADAVAAAGEALAVAGDAVGEAKAHSVHALALSRLGKVGACEAALDRALAAARRAGDRRRANTVLAGAPLAALWGPGPVARASGRCLDVVRVLRITQGAPGVEAVALRSQAVLEALRGRSEAARRMIASSRRMVEELGITQGLLETEYFAGLIELIEGDAAAAEQSLRAAYEGFRSHGLGIDAARAAAQLGRTLLARGRAADAEALSHESEALAGDDLQAAITWRRLRAEALARRGEHAAAVDFARAAVEIAAATDALLHHADARRALATALRAAGRSDEADAEEARAVELWEAKGATLLAERARREVGRLVEVEPAPVDRDEPARRVRRRVRLNAVTAAWDRMVAALAVGDVGAAAAQFSDSLAHVHHPTGTSYGREAAIWTFQRLLRSRDPSFSYEALATLGETLELGRFSTAGAGAGTGRFDVGNYEGANVVLGEIDGERRFARTEAFAADRLGDAVARLYERYAELLPEGPERERAATTARSVAAMLGAWDPERWAAACAPAIEGVDHRFLGTHSGRGAAALLQGWRAWTALADDITVREDDVLGLQHDALLSRRTFSGTDRATGGAFERPFFSQLVFGGDGLVTRIEWFDADRDTEALARFDALTAGPPAAPPVQRRVRPNAATANAARLDRVIADRDADALPTLFADDVQCVDHRTGTRWDRKGWLFTLRSLLHARDPRVQHEPLATLGASLALCRWSTSGSGFVGGTFDVGAYEREEIPLVEVDAQGRARRRELFAADHLGEALARLYERYAELLPEGPERTRAAATARSVARLDEIADPDRWVGTLAPEVEFVDRRALALLPPASGAEALGRMLRSLHEVARDPALRVDDVLALRADAHLFRCTNSGTDRAGGGAFERELLVLRVFGGEGLVTRYEFFDPECAAGALARFDELTADSSPARSAGAPPGTAATLVRRVRPNAALDDAFRFERALAARDVDAIAAHLTDSGEVVNHATGTQYDREAGTRLFHSLAGERDATFRIEPLATLGDSLALHRARATGTRSGAGDLIPDIGAFEHETVVLVELDAQGRRRRSEVFASERLGDAVTRLYERYAELLPEGPERTRAAATARLLAAFLGPFDPDRYATAIAPTLDFVDHRSIVGIGSARGAGAFLAWMRTLAEVAVDVTVRLDDTLDLRSDAALLRVTTYGTARAAGGAVERHFLSLLVFGPDGLVGRLEHFDTDQYVQALARFDELTAKPPPARIQNAATLAMQRSCEAWQARDWERFAARGAAGFRGIDRRRLVRLELDGDAWLASYRQMFEMTSGFHADVLATRGERLAMMRFRWEGADRSIGPSEIESLGLVEVDGQGDVLVVVEFDPDDLEAAYAELDARYAAGEAAPHAAMLATFQRLQRGVAARDWEELSTRFAADFVVEDHSPLGWGTLDRPTYLESLKALVALAPDSRVRTDHLWLCDRGALGVHVVLGMHEGGAFEQPRVTVSQLDAQGKERRRDVYTLDQLDAARARFDAIAASTPRDPLAAFARPNAATVILDRVQGAFEARDWAALRAAYRTDARIEDRRRGVLTSQDVDGLVADVQQLARSGAHYRRHLFVSAGEHVALERFLWSGHGPAGGGPVEVELLGLTEVDETGQIVAAIRFDADDWRAASREAWERWLARDAVAAAVIGPAIELIEGWNDHDRARMRPVLAGDFVVDDRRLVGQGRVDGADAYLDTLPALWDLAPEIQMEPRFVLALERHGAVAVSRLFGTLPGGGAFEIYNINVATVARGRVTRVETFELEALDAALARFADLRATSAPSGPAPPAARAGRQP